jgi:hypothetical protein
MPRRVLFSPPFHVKSGLLRLVSSCVKPKTTKPKTTNMRSTVIASRTHDHNVSRSAMYLLPAELLLHIAEYLSPASAMTLGVTYTRFYKVIATPMLEKDTSRMNRFYLFASLEVSLGPWRSKPLCGGCLAIHTNDSYWRYQLEVNATERRCKLTEKLVWLHSGFGASFNDLQHLLAELRSLEGGFHSSDRETCVTKCINVNGKDTLQFDVSINLAHINRRPSPRAVYRFLQKFNVPICPHITTGEPLVADIYRKSIRSYDPIVLDGSSYSCPVKNCKTSIRFQFSSSTTQTNWDILKLNTRRRISVGPSPETNRYLSQAIIVPDEARFLESCMTSWRWKKINEEIERYLKYGSTDLLQVQNFQLIRKRDSLHPGDIRTLFKPWQPDAKMAAYIESKNIEAIQALKELDSRLECTTAHTLSSFLFSYTS